jgi:hypothetical protein
MFYDDLPIWGFIGKVEKVQKPAGMEKRYHLFTHGGCFVQSMSILHPVKLRSSQMAAASRPFCARPALRYCEHNAGLSAQPNTQILPALPAVHFEVLYNGDRIIEINVSTDPTQTVDISPDVASKTDG